MISNQCHSRCEVTCASDLHKSSHTYHDTVQVTCTSHLTPTMTLVTDHLASIVRCEYKTSQFIFGLPSVKIHFSINTNPLQVNLHLS